jgi:hypothetical protein
MSRRLSSAPFSPRRMRLLAGVWLGRLVLIWVFAYPIYRLLSNSSMLHGTHADQRVFAPGGETLLALLRARSNAFWEQWPVLGLLVLLGVALGIAASSLVWVAIDESMPLFGKRLRLRWCCVLPAFALTTLYSIAAAALLTWSWWQMVPALGALLEPWLGERGTDYCQLSVLFVLLGALSALCVLADVVRAVLVSGLRPRGQALPTAAELYLQQPLRISLHALLRFSLALSLQLGCGWLVAHYHFLARSGGFVLLAVVLAEVVALIAVGLRLDWIDWLTRVARHTYG